MKEVNAKDTLAPICYYDFSDGAYDFYINHVLGDNVSECPHSDGSDKWKGWHHARLSRELKADLTK
jgi:hypothetical protein